MSWCKILPYVTRGGDSTHYLSATFSAHRQLTEMGQCSMESSCPEDSKKYRLISMGGLWAEQFAIKIDGLYRGFWNTKKLWFLIFWKFSIKSIHFNCKLVRSKTSHRKASVLFVIFRTRPFHRVLTHSCGWSRSWAICDLISANFAIVYIV